MTAYYNEVDAYAAEWLRNLIAAGHIAPGDVDERDIRDVRPSDLDGYTQCHFFAGIGVWSYALRLAGWPDDHPVWTGSCPCQPFSAAGKRGGFDDERHLWPAWFHLIGERRPAIVFGEQVASKDGLAWLDLVSADMEGADYAFGAVDTCSAGSGAPHIRQRLRFVAKRVADAVHAERRPFDVDREDGRNRTHGRRSQTRSDFGTCGEIRGMADADDARSQGRIERGDGAGERAAGAGGVAGRMADSDERVGGQGRSLGSGSNHRSDAVEGAGPGGGGGAGGVADALRGGTQHGPGEGLGAEAAPDGEDGRLSGQRLRLGFESATGEPRRPGPTNGFWRDADWLLCRDGKWRPVEPGTFPLVNGVANRVGRLRAYGNAVDAEATADFIRAASGAG